MRELARQAPGVVKIETIHTGDGCSVRCEHCGAYPKREDESPADSISKEVDIDRIREMLLREVKPVNGNEGGSGEHVSVGGGNEEEGTLPEAISPDDVSSQTRLRIVDYLANYVTTNVNVEPLNSDTWLALARVIKELTDENQRRENNMAKAEKREPLDVKKRLVFVSHGLLLTPRQAREGEKWEDSDQVRRLKEIVDFMQEGDVFVLSLDYARLRGKITNQQNFASYLKTLVLARQLIDKGVRITISVQGLDTKHFPRGVDPADSPLHRDKAIELFSTLKEALKNEHGWPNRDIGRLNVDFQRAWAGVGSAKRMPGIDPDGQSPVIPDPYVVEHTLDATHAQAGLYNLVSGKLWARPANHPRSYNDTAAWALFNGGYLQRGLRGWEEMAVSPDSVEDLTEQFSAAARAAMRRGEGEVAENAGGAGVKTRRQASRHAGTPPVPFSGKSEISEPIQLLPSGPILSTSPGLPVFGKPEEFDIELDEPEPDSAKGGDTGGR